MKITAYLNVRQEWSVGFETSKFVCDLDLDEAKKLFHALGSALRDVKEAEAMWDGLD